MRPSSRPSSFSSSPQCLPVLITSALLLIMMSNAASTLLTFAQSIDRCPTSDITFDGQNRAFSNCRNLATQSARIAWNLNLINESSHGTLEVFFVGTAPSPSGWVGWGINPSGLAMSGTQAFIAFSAPNGSTILTFNVSEDVKSGIAPLRCTPISLDVVSMAVQISGSVISTLVVLQIDPTITTSSVNLVWNRGASVSNFQPAAHGFTADDLASLTAVDLLMSASVPQVTTHSPHSLLKDRHAILNTVGWGILLPLGVIAARYLKPFTDPAWFYVHVLVQSIGYILGVAGWSTGLVLGNYSVGVVYQKHRFIGIALFAISTLQVCAILVRPSKGHKIRGAWNYYHYTLGVSILVLSILNIFYGFDILAPAPKWRYGYIGILGGLAGLTMVFEIVKWVHYAWMIKGLNPPQEQKLRGAILGTPNSHRTDGV